MQVDDNVSLHKRPFSSIPIGDAFINGNTPYIKTNAREEEGLTMCISLTTGLFAYYREDEGEVIHCPNASIKLYDPAV